MWYHGHDVTTLMKDATFADVVYLLHRGRLPVETERRVIDAILIASADHGPGSPSAAAMRTVATGNRAAPEAAIAAGILAIGDAHGGAGLACLELITRGVDLVKRQGQSMDAAAATDRRGRNVGRPPVARTGPPRSHYRSAHCRCSSV